MRSIASFRLLGLRQTVIGNAGPYDLEVIWLFDDEPGVIKRRKIGEVFGLQIEPQLATPAEARDIT